MRTLAGIGKIVEGINSVNGAIASGRVEKIIYLETRNGASNRLIKLIEDANLKGLAIEKVNTKENWIYNSRHAVVALCVPKKTYSETSINELKLSNIVVLDHIQDTNNFGAIIRSAAAFNFNIVCLPKKRSVNITERTFAVSSGGLENVSIVFYQ